MGEFEKLSSWAGTSLPSATEPSQRKPGSPLGESGNLIGGAWSGVDVGGGSLERDTPNSEESPERYLGGIVFSEFRIRSKGG